LASKFDTIGPIACVLDAQFIQNKSVKDNILFNLPYNFDVYNTVVSASALDSDFKKLGAGDKTMIGEKYKTCR